MGYCYVHRIVPFQWFLRCCRSIISFNEVHPSIICPVKDGTIQMLYVCDSHSVHVLI